MNKKLSDTVITELSFLTSWELRKILENFGDSYDNDYYETLKHIAKTYTDEEILPLLPTPTKCKSSDSRTVDEKLEELKSYYVKDNVDETRITTNDIPILKRGRTKSKDGTLKDKIFLLLNTNFNDQELTYDEVLKSGISIAENTYKTILSQWRKEKGIKVRRGRPQAEKTFKDKVFESYIDNGKIK